MTGPASASAFTDVAATRDLPEGALLGVTLADGTSIPSDVATKERSA